VVEERAGPRRASFSLGTDRIVSLGLDAARGALWVGRNERSRHPDPAIPVDLVPEDFDRVGCAYLVDPWTGAVRASFPGFMAVSSRSLDLARDGSPVAFARWGSGIELRDAATGELRATVPEPDGEIIAVRLDPDHGRLAYLRRNGSVARITDLSGAPLATFELASTPWSVELLPDGERVAVGTWTGAIEVWDLETHERLRTLTGHSGVVLDLSLRPHHPDQLASASTDGTVRLWSLSTGRTLMLLDEFGGWDTLGVDFDPEGHDLLVTGAAGTNRVIDLAEGLTCVRGNLAYQLERLGPDLGLDPERERPRLEALLDRAARHE